VRVPSSTSYQNATMAGSAASSTCNSLQSENDGADSAQANANDFASRLDRASMTMLVAPGLYSTRKSKSNNLLAHWCYGIVDRHWSSKNFKLKWSMRTRNGHPHRYGRQCYTAWTSLISSHSYAASFVCLGAIRLLKNTTAPSPW
jgi:hypothetical protein